MMGMQIAIPIIKVRAPHGKTLRRKGDPSDSSDDPSSEDSTKSKGNARRIPKKKKKSADSSNDSSSSSSESSHYNNKSSYKDYSSSYKKKKRKHNRRVKRSKWLDTSTAVVQMFNNSQIHPNSSDKFYRLRQVHSLLNTVGSLHSFKDVLF